MVKKIKAMLSAEELSDLGADSAYTAHIESDLNCRLAAKKQYMAESSAIGANSVNTRLNRGSRLSSEATVSCVSCSFVLLPQPRFCPAKEGTARGSPGRPIARGRGRSWALGPNTNTNANLLHQYLHVRHLFFKRYSLQQHHHDDSKVTT